MIPDFILNNVKSNKNKFFITYNNQLLTFGDFNTLINKTTKYFKSMIFSSSYVGLNIKNPIYLFQSIIALNRLNLIPIIYPPYINIKEYISTTQIDVSINDEDILEALNNNELSIVEKKYNSKSTQIVVFSSGTSGPPKPVELSYETILYNAKGWNEKIKYSKKDIYLNCLPTHHIGSINIFFRSAVFKMHMHIVKYEPKTIINFINNNSNIIISFVPIMINRMIENINTTFLVENIKSIIVGGDKLPTKLAKSCLNYSIPLYISYGMTETCSGIAGFWATKKNIDIYKYIPHKNVNIYVNNSLIIVDSSYLMKRYFNSMPIKNKFITDDLGKINEDKTFCIMGRNDDVIISGGINISISEIKRKILDINIIGKFQLVVSKDINFGKKIKIYIVDNQQNTILEYKKSMKEVMPKHMVPKEIVVVKKLDVI